ncbi:ArsR/SmtB family transcription factor [Ectobacillus ponti]|uniref:Metalloregulator ArsR/SmtB family transcription factor n=1 Tax=Ectobacillus ponti TaxID=2961894 RepID=A0AA41X5D9_9BACI|nr:metalloregulator ArsR/SmtB family transcription factor [Ectobacillus ponti]MCP8969224.1 metalloregulator ArsR/SmtB family transcription factor [Ectobacillus ponti]
MMLDYAQKQANYEDIAERLRVIAHPVRLELLSILLQQPQNVTYLYGKLGLPQSTISQHLAKLKAAGVLRGDRKGLEIFYRVTDNSIQHLMKVLT